MEQPCSTDPVSSAHMVPKPALWMALIWLKAKADLHLSYNSWCLVNLLRKKRYRLHTVLSQRQSPFMPCPTSNALLPTAPEMPSHSLDWSLLVGWRANSTIREERDSAHIRVLSVRVAKLTPGTDTGRTRWTIWLIWKQICKPPLAGPERRTDSFQKNAIHLTSSKRQGSPMHRLCESEERKYAEIMVDAGRVPKHIKKSGIYLEDKCCNNS